MYENVYSALARLMCKKKSERERHIDVAVRFFFTYCFGCEKRKIQVKNERKFRNFFLRRLLHIF